MIVMRIIIILLAVSWGLLALGSTLMGVVLSAQRERARLEYRAKLAKGWLK